MKRTRAFVHLFLPIVVLNDSRASLVAQLESACNVGDLGSVPVFGRSSGGGHGNPFQSSCLENPMDRGDWQATVHGVTKSWTRLSNKAHNTHLSTKEIQKE